MPSQPRVFVTRALPGDALEGLAQRTRCEVWSGEGPPSPKELAAAAQDCDGLLCLLTDRIDSKLLDHCTRVRVVSSCSVGLDHIDLAHATARGIRVGYTPGVLVETTADLAFALLLAAARRVVEADRFVRAAQWTWQRRWEPELLLGRDLHGGTLGVIGLGLVGRAVARRARGFDMRVLGWTRSGQSVEGVEAVELNQLLAESDFVTVHVAYSEETHGLLDAAAIAGMKRGAVLVSTARGGIVDEEALAAALKSGALAGAGLDVFADEPLDPASPLLRLPNLVVTPHIGSASVTTRKRMAALAVDNLLAGLAGRPLPHCANPELEQTGAA